MAEPKTVNAESWQTDVLDGTLPTLVHFTADWCGPCRMIATPMAELGDEFKDRLTMAKIDVDQSPEIAARYGVRSIPTLIFFRDGVPVDQIVGARPKPAMRQKIEKTLAS